MAVEYTARNDDRPNDAYGRTDTRPTARILARPLSWSAVLAGTAIAFVIQLLLTTLGMGIGMATIDAVNDANPAEGLGIAAAIWAAVSMLIALGVGGYIAGHMAGVHRVDNGVIHGLLVWAVAVLLSVYLVTTSAASLIGGGLNVLGQAGSSIAAQSSPADRRALERALTGDGGIGGTGAANGVSEADVRVAADEAADDLSTTAFATFVALLLGGVAAAVGGMIGRNRVPESREDYVNTSRAVPA